MSPKCLLLDNSAAVKGAPSWWWLAVMVSCSPEPQEVLRVKWVLYWSCQNERRLQFNLPRRSSILSIDMPIVNTINWHAHRQYCQYYQLTCPSSNYVNTINWHAHRQITSILSIDMPIVKLRQYYQLTCPSSMLPVAELHDWLKKEVYEPQGRN